MTAAFEQLKCPLYSDTRRPWYFLTISVCSADRNGNGSLDENEVLDVLLQMGLAKQQIESDDGTVKWQGYDGKTTSFNDLDKNDVRMKRTC